MILVTKQVLFHAHVYSLDRRFRNAHDHFEQTIQKFVPSNHFKPSPSSARGRYRGKEHVQLRCGVQNCPYFENNGPDWSKLRSLIG